MLSFRFADTLLSCLPSPLEARKRPSRQRNAGADRPECYARLTASIEGRSHKPRTKSVPPSCVCRLTWRGPQPVLSMRWLY